MIRHIVAWNYKVGFSQEENRENAQKVKYELEALKDCISGIIEFEVIIDPLDTSNRDVVLDSLFESEKALADYQVHPEHKRVSAFVGSVLQDRVCIDYYEK